MADSRNAFTVITLNVNGLNSPIKRYRLAEWIKKYEPSICCIQETHLRDRDTKKLKVKGWKKYFMQATAKRKQE